MFIWPDILKSAQYFISHLSNGCSLFSIRGLFLAGIPTFFPLLYENSWKTINPFLFYGIVYAFNKWSQGNIFDHNSHSSDLRIPFLLFKVRFAIQKAKTILFNNAFLQILSIHCRKMHFVHFFRMIFFIVYAKFSLLTFIKYFALQQKIIAK